MDPETLLAFQPAVAELAEARAADLAHLDGVLLAESYFEMPVRWRVGGVDLFERWVHQERQAGSRRAAPALERSVWMTLPVVALAARVPAALEDAMREGRAEYESALAQYRFEFEVARGVATVRFDATGAAGSAPIDALLDSLTRFGRGVRDLLLREVPALAGHPDLGPWFRAAT